MNRLNMDYDDEPFLNEELPEPDFFDFSKITTEAIMLYSSAHFYRNQGNSNIVLNIDMGTDISPGTIWYSPAVFLSAATFNLVKPITEIIYLDEKDALILKDLTFLHDILIQYKLEKPDGTNYINNREIRCTLVKEDGSTVYDNSIYSNQMPDPGQHDNIFLKGHIQHYFNDKVRIKFNIAQDNTNGGQSATKMTIFRITWNIMGLKMEEV